MQICACCGTISKDVVPMSKFVKGQKGYLCEEPVMCAERAKNFNMGLKIADEWEEEFGIKILDPDGWRPPYEKPLTEPLSRAEFLERMRLSTIKVLGKP